MKSLFRQFTLVEALTIFTITLLLLVVGFSACDHVFGTREFTERTIHGKRIIAAWDEHYMNVESRGKVSVPVEHTRHHPEKYILVTTLGEESVVSLADYELAAPGRKATYSRTIGRWTGQGGEWTFFSWQTKPE